ncbi:hypothetical protein BC830DRAFT_1129961 [Chytriomyces sp. MP71]|nr:hypothetical protein BC830DRAFT_1129961 [Chytriomyces sp. MP71]
MPPLNEEQHSSWTQLGLAALHRRFQDSLAAPPSSITDATASHQAVETVWDPNHGILAAGVVAGVAALVVAGLVLRRRRVHGVAVAEKLAVVSEPVVLNDMLPTSQPPAGVPIQKPMQVAHIGSVTGLHSEIAFERGPVAVFEVKHPWTPLNADELKLNEGDIVHVYQIFGDDWCVGFVMGREEVEGTFPRDCLSDAPLDVAMEEEDLEDKKEEKVV